MRMTNQEAIETIKANYPPENYSMLREALDMALSMLEKQELMKPIYNEEKFGNFLPHCPVCKKVLPNISQYGKSNFCHNCGQAVKY